MKTFMIFCFFWAIQQEVISQTFGSVQYNPFGVNSIQYASIPNLTDIDNDGDLDLFYGDFFTGSLVYRVNTGTSTTASFGAAVNNPFGVNLSNSFTPELLDFVDIDNDGDQDLFVASADTAIFASIAFFQNTGTSTSPAFSAPTINPFNISFSANFPVGAPSFVDIDNDGDQDLFIATDDGNTLFLRNTGTATTPSFAAPSSNPFGLPATLFGMLMDFSDVDQDGDYDLLADDGEGAFLYYQNTGTGTSPSFAAAISNPFGLSSIDPDFNNTPHFADIDNDGDDDIFASNWSDTLFYFENMSQPSTTCNFSANAINVNENAGTISITLNLSNALAVLSSIQVTLLSGSSATNNTDFTFTSPTLVNFAAGVTSQTITIPITNDNSVEANESFTLSLSNPTGGLSIGTTNTTQVTIIDNDVYPSINFSGSNISVNENAGTVSVTLNIADGNTNATSVDVVLNPSSTASSGSDFTYTSPTTVTFPANSSASQTITIPIIDDVLTEGAETIVLGLSNPTNNATTSGTYIITINPSDQQPTVSFSGSNIYVDENVGTVSITLNITDANTNATSVDVLLKSTSTASSGSDFTYTSPTTVTFPANSSASQTITIPIIDDVLQEGVETIVLELSNPTNSAIASGNYTINIRASDIPPIYVSFDTSSLTVSEDVGSVTIGVTITNPNNNPTTVDILASLSSTTSYLDFNGSYTATNFTFPANSTAKKTFTITINDDTNIEGLETLILDIKYPTNNAILSPYPQLRLNIIDNEGSPQLGFANTTFDIQENKGGSFIHVARTGSTSSTVNTTISVASSSTATQGIDFDISNPSVSLFPGFSSDVFFVTVYDDALIEGDETIDLILTNSSGLPFFQETMTITIKDNEQVSTQKIEQQEPTIKIYPIPAQDYLIVELDSAEDLTVSILSLSGQVIQQQTYANKAILKMPVHNIIDGVYLLAIHKNGVEQPMTKHILIQR